MVSSMQHAWQGRLSKVAYCPGAGEGCAWDVLMERMEERERKWELVVRSLIRIIILPVFHLLILRSLDREGVIL